MTFLHVLAPHQTVPLRPPELSGQDLTLWRLRRGAHEQLWCAVYCGAGGLVLTVQDPTTRQAAIALTGMRIAPLVNRADTLRDQLVSAGWREIDIDPEA